MIARRSLKAFASSGLLILALSACGSSDQYRLHALVTVYVDTPQGVRMGSSIYEVRAGNLKQLLPDAAGRGWSTIGEAVAIELPNGKTLFTLSQTHAVQGDTASMILATLDDEFNNTMVESTKRFSGWGKGYGDSEAKQVAKQNYPVFVTFADMQNPKSVMQVDPGNLTPSLGAGYELRSITVQLTDRRVTTGIERRLKWIDNLDRYRSDPNNPFTEQLPSEIGALRERGV